MPAWGEAASKPAVLWWSGAAVTVFVAGLLAMRQFLRSRPTAEELERRRRAALHRSGKVADAEVTDVDVAGASIVYSYQVRGVGYTASQDVSLLQSVLPSDPMSMFGPASIKFDPRNPANSIVVCEEWSGLRDRETQSRLA